MERSPLERRCLGRLALEWGRRGVALIGAGRTGAVDRGGSTQTPGSSSATSSSGSGSSAYTGYQVAPTNPDLWCPLGSKLGHGGNSGSAGKQGRLRRAPEELAGCGSNGGNGGGQNRRAMAATSLTAAMGVPAARAGRRVSALDRRPDGGRTVSLQRQRCRWRQRWQRWQRAERGQRWPGRSGWRWRQSEGGQGGAGGSGGTPKVPSSAAPEVPVVPVAGASCTTLRTGSRARHPEAMEDKAATGLPEQGRQRRQRWLSRHSSEHKRWQRGERRKRGDLCKWANGQAGGSGVRSPERRESVARTARMVRAPQVDEP